MQNKYKVMNNKVKISFATAYLLVLAAAFLLIPRALEAFPTEQASAATTPQLSTTISAGTLTVDIVDAGGNTVGSPAVTMDGLTYSYTGTQTTGGVLATSTQKIRVTNNTATTTDWTLNIAGSATTALWTDGGSNTFDFNDGGATDDSGGVSDTDTKGGTLTVDPDPGTSDCAINGVSGTATTGLSLGTSDVFEEEDGDDVGTDVTSSIDLITASGGASSGAWDYYCTGAADGLSQLVPAAQAPAVYTLSLSVTVS